MSKSAPEPLPSPKAGEDDARLMPNSLDAAGSERRANVAFWIYISTVGVLLAYSAALGTMGWGQFALK